MRATRPGAVKSRLSVVGELELHYDFLDEVEPYGAAMAGFAVHL